MILDCLTGPVGGAVGKVGLVDRANKQLAVG